VPVTPAASTPEGEHTGFLGVEAAAKSETVNPVVAAGRSGQMLANMTGASVEALGSFFSPESIGHYADLVAGEKTTNPAKVGTASDPNANRPLSLVGVGRLADQAAETGWSHVVELLVILNVFIAVFNLIPLLPFDGGHVAIATYERLRSRKQRRYHADVSKMMPVTAIVFALVVTLGVTSIYLDIFNPVANPFH
jgi:membrane-associated protease RseP (regulator of RpoE activity)